MSIEEYNGDLITPKQKAEELYFEVIRTELHYWDDSDSKTAEMTDREIEMVRKQMRKVADRLVKVLHYEPI